MLLSLTGAQSTGKSTLLELCCKHELFSQYHCVREVTRKVKREQLVDINEAGNNITQLFILSEHLHNHHLTNDAILDRCIIDGMVYTEYLDTNYKVDYWVWIYAKNLFNQLIKRLDYVFYTDPADVKLVDDGERSTDVQFRDDIIEGFDKWLGIASKHTNVVKVSGTPTERLEQIVDIVDKKN